MELHVSLVGRKNLTGEIYRQIRQAIVEGRLRPGDPLPPSRELARRLSVSRTTVVEVYDRLGGEGLTTARVGAGTFVSEHIPHTQGRSAGVTGALRPRSVWRGIPISTTFAAEAEFDFRTGHPDVTLFPYKTWLRLTGRELRASTGGRSVYGDPAGNPELRDAIARQIGTSRGVAASADDVTITNGTQQALDVVARVLLAPGDRVAVEDPGYTPPRHLFQTMGLAVSGVPVDDQGLVVDALPRDARMVYVTPSHQYPLGSTMSLRRRIALLAWAQRHNAAIVEDDYDSEFRYGSRPIEPLHTLDTTGRVIYVGSFSKTLHPGLRLGFLVAPAALQDALHAAKYLTDWYTPLATQATLARFIDQGYFARHVRKMRDIYRARHQRILHALAGPLGKHLTPIPSAAGLHIGSLATQASPPEITEVTERAKAAGVAVQPLSRFALDQPARSGFALGYGAIPATDIDEGLHRLQRSLEAVL